MEMTTIQDLFIIMGCIVVLSPVVYVLMEGLGLMGWYIEQWWKRIKG